MTDLVTTTEDSGLGNSPRPAGGGLVNVQTFSGILASEIDGSPHRSDQGHGFNWLPGQPVLEELGLGATTTLVWLIKEKDCANIQV